MHLLEPNPSLRPSARAALQHHVFDGIIPYPYRNQQQRQHVHSGQKQQQQQQQQQQQGLRLKSEPSSPARLPPPGPFDSPRKRFGMYAFLVTIY